jgi:selenocysteine lyase/cysteine desulfurase
LPPLTYLNNAATSFPKAPGLGEEVRAWIEKVPYHSGRSGSPTNDPLRVCRKRLARLLGIGDPARLVLTKGATESLNIALHGLPLNGRTVLSTAAEHNSVLRPLYLLEKKKAIDLCLVPCDNQGRVQHDEWRRLVQERRPALAVLTHASNVTGAVHPVEELFAEVHEYGGLTLLDASQTIGLLPIDVERLGADLLAFTGHKYLLGPAGTGGLYIRPGIELAPLFVGGTGVRSDLPEMPPEMPVRLEPGTPAVALFAGLDWSLKWQEQNPQSLAALSDLLGRLEEGLLEAGARVVVVNGDRTPLISFTLPHWQVADAGKVLEKSFEIICRTGLHCAPRIHEWLGTLPGGTIRFSLSRFTHDTDIAMALQAVRRLQHETP